MRIDTQEQYDNIPDFTELKLVQTGDGWDDEKGKVFNVIKMGDRLKEISAGGWDFSERNDIGENCPKYEDFSFVVIK